MFTSRTLGYWIAFGAIVALLAVASMRWQRVPPPAADPAELAREAAENRQEARVTFADPKPPTDEQTKEFTPILMELGAAIRAADTHRINACLNSERLVDELARAGVFANLGLQGDQRIRNTVRDGMRTKFAATLALKKDYFVWDRCEIRKVRLARDGSEAVVMAMHFLEVDGDSISVPMRWWMIRGGAGWQIYDFEELQMGLRISSAMAAAATPDAIWRGPELQQVGQVFHEIYQAVSTEDFPAADLALAKIRGKDLPRPFRAVRSMMEALVATSKADGEAALRHLNDAEAANPDMPAVHMIRAIAHNQRGAHILAIDATDRYMEQLGPDPIVLLQRGQAQEQLERVEAALESYRRGLDADPHHWDCLHSLCNLLPKGAKAEVVDRLRKRKTTPIDKLAIIANALAYDPDPESLDAVAGIMRKVQADHPDLPVHAAQIALARKQTDKALDQLHTALAATDEDREYPIDRIVRHFQDANQLALAYNALPEKEARRVFKSFSHDILEDFEDDDEELAAARKRYDPLAKLHRGKFPKDGWLPYFDGRFAEMKDEHAKAEDLFRQSLKLMTEDGDRQSVRYSLVEALYEQKRGHAAYTEFAGEPEVYSQLAWRFDTDKDLPGLRKLTELHRAKRPDDPAIKYWTAAAHWQATEYEPAAKAYRDYLAATRDEKYAMHRWQAQSNLVRALVRLKKPADARTELRTFQENFDPRLDAVIDGALGDAPAVLETMDKLMAKGTYQLRYLYDDPDLGPVLRSPAMKAVREKYPEPKPDPAPNGKPIG
jgi:tetratricopeptide (TPR) repeat protein